MLRRIKLVPPTLILLAFFGILTTKIANAQVPYSYGISAKAGYVNFVEGGVAYKQSNKDQWKSVLKDTQLADGDQLETGITGRVELLLNPGSYMRLAQRSKLTIHQTDFEDMRFGLIAGTMIIEASNLEQQRLMIEIATPESSIKFKKNGLYRIDVASEGKSTVTVLRGKAIVGSNALTVKKGQKALISRAGNASPQYQIAKIAKDEVDSFDAWSKQRAELLALANQRLSRRLVSSFSQRPSYGMFGVWVYNSLYGCYTYLPFGWGFSSPYGISYRNRCYPIDWYRNYNDYNVFSNTGGGWNSGSSIGSGGYKADFPSTSTYSSPTTGDRGSYGGGTPSPSTSSSGSSGSTGGRGGRVQ